MDITLTIMEFVKRLQLSQSLAKMAFTLITQEAVLLVQLDANHAQALLFVQLALKMGTTSLVEPA
jgi:hypothetical protein